MSMTMPPAPADNAALGETVNRVVADHQGSAGDLLTVLELLQARHEHNYLPPETLGLVAQRMGLPLSQVYSVVTFYAFFNLEPQGRHTVCVCRGTACHTRGSRGLLEDLKGLLGVRSNGEADKASITTDDRRFTLRTVACFGQCAMAPVIEIDRTIHGAMNRQTLRSAVSRIQQAEGAGA